MGRTPIQTINIFCSFFLSQISCFSFCFVVLVCVCECVLITNTHIHILDVNTSWQFKGPTKSNSTHPNDTVQFLLSLRSCLANTRTLFKYKLKCESTNYKWYKMIDILKGNQFEVTTAPKIPFYFWGVLQSF